MKCDKQSMYLYAVTDRTWLGDTTLAEAVEQAILGGATFVQLREKTATKEEFISIAKELKAVCGKYQVPFVINDDVEVALAVDADGVHVGQSDMEAGLVRERMGQDKIIGVSTRNVAEAKLAEQMGADYIGVGAMFSTQTKLNTLDVSFDTLRDITNNVSIPVVAIGGISLENVEELSGCGMDGVAVVSALFAKEDIQKAAKDMCQVLEHVVQG